MGNIFNIIISCGSIPITEIPGVQTTSLYDKMVFCFQVFKEKSKFNRAETMFK